MTAGGGSASYTEDGSAVAVAPSLTLTDTENTATEIKSASVTITTNYSAADGDALNISGATCTANNLVCSGSGTQTITITGGNESASEFQNVLRAITFSNTSQDPGTSSRTVEFTVTDDYDRDSTSTRDVDVVADNDAPTVTLWNNTPSFTEDVSGAVTLDSTVTVSDDESSDQISQATIEITNDQTGDTLACSAGFPGGGSCSYSSGVLTISGTDSRSNYETYIEGVQYNNTSDTPNTTNRTVRLIVQDDGTPNESSTAADLTLSVASTNDAPTVAAWDGTPAFVEDVSGAVTLDSTVTLSDPETSDQISQATIEITNDQTGDTLACTAGFPGGGSCSYSSGVLTISGTDSRTNYETYIEGVQFDNTSDTPDTTNRTVRLIVQDDGTPNESSTQADITLTVADTNDDPTASDDGAAGGSPNGFVSVQEGNTVDNGTDADGTNDDLRDNDNDPDGDALTTTQSASCVGGAGAAPSNASSFTLDTDGTFSYTHDGTNTTTDSFSYCVFDGTAYSSLATVYIDITPVNDAPTINDFSGTTGTYTEQTPLTIDADVTFDDTDSTNLTQATVQITGGYENGSDTLACTVGGLSCSFDAGAVGGGLLTISGSATKATYDTELQGVQFDNSSDDPSTATRTLSLSVLDDVGTASSVETKTITTFTLVNDQPSASDDGAAGSGNGFVTLAEGASVTGAGDLRSNDSDPDGDALTTTQSGCSGGTASGPSNDSAFTLNTDGSFDYTHDGSETTSDSFTYCVSDGSLASTLATVYIEVTPANDAPLLSSSAGTTAFTEQTAVIIDSDVTLSDAEGDNLNRALVTISGNYETGVDTLSCTVTTGVTCDYSTAPTLTITGNATLAQYEAVLEGVEFSNNSDNPDTSSRTIDFSIRDTNNDSSAIDSKTLTVTRANDPPTIAAIADQVAFEDTAADPYTLTVTAVAGDVDVDDDTNTGDGSLTYSLSGEPAGMTISNAAANPGEINWNPTMTGTFGQVYGPITVSVEDGDEDSSAANSVTFSVTVSPPDDDGDLVPNYDDLCLTVADASNADNDGDGTPGSDGGANDGGDVCDLDDDDDGMPDTYELANSLDPFDAADAAADPDGDGITNLQEYLDGTDPNFANLSIDATGYLTPFDLPTPDPTIVDPSATAMTPSDPGPYRPGRNTIVWTASNLTNPNLGTANQTLDVRPLVNFGANQQVEEGAAATVDVILNGDPPEYPVTVNYTISGTASNPADHNAASGSVVFTSPNTSETIALTTAADALTDPNETIVFTIDSATNAAIGSKRTHRITIVEANVAPALRLQFSQGGGAMATTYAGDGLIDIDALVTDINAVQTHAYDWSATDSALLPPGDVATWQIDPTTVCAVPPCNFRIDVSVTDSGSPALSTRARRILNIAAGSAAALAATDTDGDGTNDDIEGHADDDGDGIPNYLDANESGPGDTNLIPDQTVDFSETLLLQTDTGLSLGSGGTAQAAASFGALLTDEEIEMYGSESGTPPTAPDDDRDHFGGIYDFEVSGLTPGDSVNVVIPLLSAIPRDAVYRKFNPATGWSSFVVDANNRIASATGEDGACPEPGSDEYRSGLNYLDNCVQLTIEDGGPNDTDNSVNGIVTDPGTVGARLSDPGESEVESGSSRMPPSLLLMMLALGLFAARRRMGRVVSE